MDMAGKSSIFAMIAVANGTGLTNAHFFGGL
jgi:hypothetical protein